MPIPYLSVIIPAYNEERRIVKTLRRIHEYLSRQAYTYEIILVIDGAKDKTFEAAEKLKPEVLQLTILNRRENRGKGFTVKQGMLASKGRIRLFSDADNSTDIAHFDKMRPFFDKGADVVIASRDKKDAAGARQKISQAWYKRLMGNMGNLFIQIVAVRGVWDTQCGFKAFRDYAAVKVFSQSRISRWGFDIEALTLSRALGYKIAIIPALWENDPESRVKLSGYLQVLWETVKVKINFWRGVYKI